LSWFVKEDRRASTRHRYDGNNTWIRLEGSLTRPCQVFDLSRTGVRLAVENAHSLPSTFTLILSKNSSGCRPARVKWRHDNEVGAEFIKVDSSLASRSTPPRANSSSASRSNSAPPRVNSSSASHLSTGAAEKPQGGHVIGSISSDKAKTEGCSKTADLSEQLDRANQKKDSKKRMDLSRLQKKLGPDHVALIHALGDVDPESLHGQELTSIIESLDETCD
jgi:hypothetical protein